jgi:hypothetical protein
MSRSLHCESAQPGEALRQLTIFQEGAVRLPRMTTRRWMLVVVVVAVATRALTVAWSVGTDTRER